MNLGKKIEINGQWHNAVRHRKDKLFLPLAQLCHRIGLSANAVSWLGFGIAIVSCVVLLNNSYGWFVILMAVSTAFDGLDGTMARAFDETSPFGKQLDYYLDMATMLFMYSALLLYVQEPIWVVGLNLYLLVMFINWIVGEPITIGTGRTILFIPVLLYLPRIGFVLIGGYALLMLGSLLTLRYGKRHANQRPPNNNTQHK